MLKLPTQPRLRYRYGLLTGFVAALLLVLIVGASLRKKSVPPVADPAVLSAVSGESGMPGDESTASSSDERPRSDLSRTDYNSPTRYPAVKIPTKLSFAGESVPMTDMEVRERLDREMLINAYWHSNTLQNIKLANRWFPEIERILKRYGLPEDFKYLAVAESGLRNVVSPAKAAGTWQIMKATGVSYGMTINDEIDERYDVARSSEVACQYIQDAYDRFGSWTLAAASYNMGMPSLAARLSDQQVDTYYDLLLNEETARYMFRVLAFKLIYENHERFGFILDDEDVYHPLKYTVVEVNESIPNLAAFAREHQTTYKMLKYLNPWLRTGRLSVAPGQTYQLKLPDAVVVGE